MKKLVSILLSLSIAAVALAQNQGGHKHGDWQKHFEKIKAERVAFITSEVGLTSQEAEVFWPVYNKIEAAQIELNKSERKAYMALCKALSTGEGDSAALLDAYLEAKACTQCQRVQEDPFGRKGCQVLHMRGEIPHAADRPPSGIQRQRRWTGRLQQRPAW